MNNTTLLISSSSMMGNVHENYDAFGAIVFIIFVLCWYSLSAAFMLRIQTMTHREISHDPMKYSTKGFTRHSHDKHRTQRILEELADKRKREKLWKIYFGTSTSLNKRMNQVDLQRVRNIQRQLANLAERNGHYDHGRRTRSVSEDDLIDSHTESSISDVNYPMRVRRLSETNQQILQYWQTAIQDLKVKEMIPWTIQKLLIKRHLRRQRQLGDYHCLRQESLP